MRDLKKILLIFLFLFLVGCSSYTVSIPTEIEFEKTELDVCQFITKINDIEIRDFNRFANKIEEGEYHVACPTMQIKALGKQEVTISINSVDVAINFNVIDTTAPEIKIPEKLEVEENNEYFDIKKLVAISDLYDKNPIVGFNGDYDLATPGVYSVTISAKDNSDNKASLDINVAVTEKDVEVIEKEVYVNNGGNPAPSTLPPVNNSNPMNQAPIQPSSLPSKTFLFSEGLDMNSGFTTCQQYRGNNSGSCSPLRDGNGISYGYIYNP